MMMLMCVIETCSTKNNDNKKINIDLLLIFI
jgi:hypothetical protein